MASSPSSRQYAHMRGRLHKYLEERGIENLEQAERRINYDAVIAYEGRLRRMGMPEDQIKDTVNAALEVGARNGGVGILYNAGKVRRAGRYIAQSFRDPQYKTHPSGNQTRKDAMLAIHGTAGLSNDMKILAKDIADLEDKRSAIYSLREANLISGYKARSLENKLQRRMRKDTKDLTGILAAEIAAVLFFVAGAFLLGLSVGKPAVMGYAVLDGGVSPVANSSLFGLGFLVVGVFVWFFVRRK